MDEKKYNQIAAISVFIALPLFIYFTGGFPGRTLLKELISVLTIMAFFVMLLQFYMSRANNKILRTHKMGKVNKWHKVVGYIFVSVLLIHPLSIVFPRYFESGLSPIDAFVVIITEFGSQGIILGLIAWGLMLIIGITSFFRNNLGLSYKNWRVLHGILSIAFIAVADFHVIDMGKHINLPMVCLIALLSIGGITILLKLYIFKPANQPN